jgi:hypothetical protein
MSSSAIIDRRAAGHHPRTQFELNNSWLLFAADFDGLVDATEGGRAQAPQNEVQRYLDEVGTRKEL